MISYMEGDLLNSHCNVICHQVNCSGAMGSGIARQIRSRYPKVYETFRATYEQGKNILGAIDIVLVQDFSNRAILDRMHRRFVINMYAQKDYNRSKERKRQTNYNALRHCIQELKKEIVNYLEYCNDECAIKDFIIGFPYGIGCGLACGDWNIVRDIIESEFADDKWNVEIWKYTSDTNKNELSL